MSDATTTGNPPYVTLAVYPRVVMSDGEGGWVDLPATVECDDSECDGKGNLWTDSMTLYGIPGGHDAYGPCPLCNPGGDYDGGTGSRPAPWAKAEPGDTVLWGNITVTVTATAASDDIVVRLDSGSSVQLAIEPLTRIVEPGSEHEQARAVFGLAWTGETDG